jgi:hypothetical protein
MFVIPQSSSVEGEESYSSKKRYQKHVQLLKKIISTIILEQDDRLTSDEANILMQLINLTYAACKIFPESNYDNLKIKSWPTLDTLLEVTEKEIKKMNKSQQLNTGILPIYQKLYRLVLIYTTGGTLDGLFNKHTNIVIDDSFKLISFNLYGLLDSTSENIQQAMMLIVTNFFTREMINHRRKFPRENDPNATFINFVVDEFHKVVDDHNTFMLEDIAHKYQQVRKYYCNYIIATPSIVTFTKSNNPTVLKNMQTILDNSMFKFILSMTVDALEKEVNAKLFGENTKLTANEIQYLADSNENDAGKFIFISNAQDRIMGHIDSGNKIPRDKFNTSLANISEIAQL